MTFEVDGQPRLGFNTGLDSRAFAQLKFDIGEPGVIISLPDAGNPQGSVDYWNAAGVVETADVGGTATMVVWGPQFTGDRLDTLLGSGQQEKALAAVRCWIRAILILEENPSVKVPLLPCAAIVGADAVFFAPEILARRCFMQRSDAFGGGEWYVHPDLSGINAAAFTAAAMLYRLFTGEPPFPAAEGILLHQDMRDGNFLPIRFAEPGLDTRLTVLIGGALTQNTGKVPVRRKQPGIIVNGVPGENMPHGAELLSELSAIIQNGASSLLCQVSPSLRESLEKEKAKFLKANNVSVNTRRFITRNKTPLLGVLAAVFAAIFVIRSIVGSRAALPNTKGMEPVQVIESYFNSYGELDHQMMEACVTTGAGKDDINMVVSLFVANKVRQAYEMHASPMVISAREWQERGGGPVDAQVFGVTGLQITEESGQWSVNSGQLKYRIDYTLWVPVQVDDETAEYQLPVPINRCEIITLVRQKGNWRISEIITLLDLKE